MLILEFQSVLNTVRNSKYCWFQILDVHELRTKILGAAPNTKTFGRIEIQFHSSRIVSTLAQHYAAYRNTGGNSAVSSWNIYGNISNKNYRIADKKVNKSVCLP